MSAELELMEEGEREAKKKGEVQEVLQTDVVWKPRLEESRRHWGVRVRGGERCGICGLSLSVKLSSQHPGLLAFHCGTCMCHTDSVLVYFYFFLQVTPTIATAYLSSLAVSASKITFQITFLKTHTPTIRHNTILCHTVYTCALVGKEYVIL